MAQQQATPVGRCSDKSLVGITHNISILENLEFYLNTSNGPTGCNVRYLGGLRVLLSFDSNEEALDYLKRTEKGWKVMFSSLKLWKEERLKFQRIAWVNVLGVPPNLFSADLINSVAETCGVVVQGSTASCSGGNLSYGRVAVISESGARIESKVTMNVSNLSFTCWIHEGPPPWTPNFLKGSSRLADSQGVGEGSTSEEKSEQLIAEEGSPEKAGNRNSPAIPVTPPYDTIFEQSLVARLEDLEPLEFNVINDLFVEMIAVQKLYHGKKNHITGSLLDKNGYDNSNGGINMDGLADNVLGQNKNNNHQGLFSGAQDNSMGSDPFGLGPLIEVVMAQNVVSNNSGDSSNNSRCDNHFIDPSNRGKNKKNRFKLPDLNEEICCLNRLRLSSRLLCGRRNKFQKRGKSNVSGLMETGSDETSSSQKIYSNETITNQANLNRAKKVSDCVPHVILDDIEGEAGPGVYAKEGVGDSCSRIVDEASIHPLDQMQNRSDDDESVHDGQIEDEVASTIMDNTLIWSWRWKRELVAVQEKTDLADLTLRLANVCVGNGADTWNWGNHGEQDFSTRHVKNLIQKNAGDDDGYQFP
ncbi:hypothetical protein QVD17_23802 [Tagetes erecta]|uniref:DUF4283 domain-containing protein n=1 Tax=Tagetes erecta TaxID=13708 RepID=A0AAD8NUA1_TARER|nr:hypothetical protein QVD17_23802 [Tagetes erecta]